MVGRLRVATATALLAVTAAHCSRTGLDFDVPEAGVDAGADAGAGADASVGADSGAGADARADAGARADADAGPDGSLDAPTDSAPSDAPPDAFDSGPIVHGSSCADGGDGLSNCGPTGESCCTSLPVPGGTFDRTYDPYHTGADAAAPSDPATVSSFRLDKYEITVGRFRQYVEYMTSPAGAPPTDGSGKHVHVNGGRGLVDEAKPGNYEHGWDATWNTNLPTGPASIATWNTNLTGGADPQYDTWTASPGPNEKLPLNRVTWFELYAFCIWDGGFLPSQAEWEYASAGGAEQRLYPWGGPTPQDAGPYDYAIYNCYWPTGQGGQLQCMGVENIAPVGSAPLGAGRWGQLDLGGNVAEENLDYLESDTTQRFFADPCVDCSRMTPPQGPSNQLFAAANGESFQGWAPSMSASWVYWGLHRTDRFSQVGARCARSP